MADDAAVDVLVRVEGLQNGQHCVAVYTDDKLYCALAFSSFEEAMRCANDLRDSLSSLKPVVVQ